MTAYLDASFLVSLCTVDINSPVAARIMEDSKGIRIVSTLAELEALNALKLRVFRKEITVAQADLSAQAFEKDLREGVFRLQPLTEQTFERARQLSRQNTARLGTRTADSLHVAAALTIGADYLYTFDQQQRKLARTVGLKLS
ncbi:MAG: type II toxin-antitoxin system VapC family toxin [Terriglobales bacterium]